MDNKAIEHNEIKSIFSKRTVVIESEFVGTIFSQNLIEYRKKAGLTQREVAEIIGVNNHNVICNWEKAVSVPNIKNLILLCETYKTTPNHLLGFNSVK
jgi:DNA-binding XRE family transcriptional regulator